jgi:hypothetical protein
MPKKGWQSAIPVISELSVPNSALFSPGSQPKN